MPNKLSQFWQELRRRKVIKVLFMYAGAAIVLIGLASDVAGPLNLPDWAPRLIIILVIIGFPIAVIFAWIFDITAKGIKKTEPLESSSGENEASSITDKTGKRENSIIVLPFENMSSDPEQEYFSDGLTEEIITDLSYIHDLMVISRSSAMTFKGTKKKTREIANEVNVKYVLEGSVRKSGNNLRITGQLIDAASDTHIWAKKYSGTLEDIFDIQEKVSSSIANELKIKISSEEKKKIQERPIDNVFAYDCYKRAYPEINSMSKERLDYGLNLLQKGLGITGENALIYSGIAITYIQYVNIGFKPEENLDKAKVFLQKALDLDPELPEAHFALGIIEILDKDGHLFRAIDHWNQAHQARPEDPEIMIYLSWGYAIAGQDAASKVLVDRCVRVDPLNPLSDAVRGWHHFFGGRFEIAIDYLFAAYELNPESPMHQFFKAIILVYNDRSDDAYDFICEFVEESSKNMFSQVTIFLKYSIKRDKDKLTSSLTPEFVKQIQRDLQHPYHIATFYSYIEEKEESLKWLENAVNRGFINYPLLSEQDKLLNNIRGEERFKKLMKRVKHEWENFEV